MSGWHKGVHRSIWGMEEMWASPQCVLSACSKCDTPGRLWPRCSRHPDMTREVHLPPLSFLSSLVVNITQSIIIPLSASRGEAPRPTSPTTSYSAKGFPRPRIDQPQHHSCKGKAGLQTAAVFVSLSSLKKTRNWNADWMLPYFSTASGYYSHGHSDSVRSRIWTCARGSCPAEPTATVRETRMGRGRNNQKVRFACVRGTQNTCIFIL